LNNEKKKFHFFLQQNKDVHGQVNFEKKIKLDHKNIAPFSLAKGFSQ